MNSLILQPPQILNPFVRNIRVLDVNNPDTLASALPFYADGHPGIMYQSSTRMLINSGAKKLSPFFLYGQTVKPIELFSGGGYRVIIFYLYPHVTKSLFGLNSNELTDDCLDLRLLPNAAGIGITNKLLNTSNPEQQVDIINQYLVKMIRKNEAEIDSTVHYAVSHILNSRSGVSIKSIRKYMNVSERTFERKFEYHVGISPKLFSRIAQFRAALVQVKNQEHIKLSDIAYDNGYADQSHFIRAFKEFTGMVPLEFKKQPIPQPSYS